MLPENLSLTHKQPLSDRPGDGSSDGEPEFRQEPPKKQHVVKRWIANISKALLADDGWRLIGKVLALLGGVLGLFLTWHTLQSSIRNEDYRRAEDAYASLLSDLNSPLERVRANAISRLPLVLTRRVYPPSSPFSLDSILSLIGLDGGGTPIYLSRLRREIHDYVHASFQSTGLSNAESKELVRALDSLGPSGWYKGEIQDAAFRRSGLAWIWQPAPSIDRETVNLTHSLFVKVNIRGVDFSGYDLSQADFTSSTVEEVSFIKSILNDSIFRGASIVKGDFHNSQLRRVQLQKSQIEASKFDGCSMQASSLTGVRFIRTYLSRVDFSPLPLQNNQLAYADLSRVEFIDSNISDISAPFAKLFGVKFISTSEQRGVLGASHSNFQNADLRSGVLDGVNFSECAFENAKLEAVSARGARFRFAKFENADLDKADFSGADLSDASGFRLVQLLNGTGIKSCRNMNIANVIGLSSEEKEELLRLGAVNIPEEKRWREYKQQSFPLERWKEFL